MADIDLLIKIPEEIRLALMNNIQLTPDQKSISDSYISQAIIDGTPLPKGHGRLIDADDIDNHIMGHVDTRSCPTIIEADEPKRKKGIPLEENDSGYNCEDWIP